MWYKSSQSLYAFCCLHIISLSSIFDIILDKIISCNIGRWGTNWSDWTSRGSWYSGKSIHLCTRSNKDWFSRTRIIEEHNLMCPIILFKSHISCVYHSLEGGHAGGGLNTYKWSHETNPNNAVVPLDCVESVNILNSLDNAWQSKVWDWSKIVTWKMLYGFYSDKSLHGTSKYVVISIFMYLACFNFDICLLSKI